MAAEVGKEDVVRSRALSARPYLVGFIDCI